MKVLSIGTDRNIFKKGSAVRARAVEYGELFDELHIVVYSNTSEKEQISPKVWIYPTHTNFKIMFFRDAFGVCKHILRSRDFNKTRDVITTQDPFETGLVGLKLKKKFSYPLHVQIHTDFLSPYFRAESFLNKIRIYWAKKVLAAADSVRVVSERIKKSIEDKNLTNAKIQVIPIFTDIKRIEETEPKTNLKEKYRQFNFIILMASRLTKEKNIPLALEAMSRIHKAYNHAGLVIVGDGPEKRRLISKAKRLGLERNVIFEGWQDDMISYYKTANMFLTTSFYEGFGLTMIEAIAAHCPVVGTDAGIAPLLLKDGEVTFVCPVNDAECLWNRINILITDTPLRERFVHEAFDRLNKITFTDKNVYLAKYKESIEMAQKK